MDESFSAHVERERPRLNGERDPIFAQQQELESRLETVRADLHAIEVYEAAKSGRSPSAGRTGGRRQSTGRRGSKLGRC